MDKVEYAARSRMAAIDEMPKAWRDLANSYGAVVTIALYDERYTLEQATEALASRHYRRQEELLSTDYHIDRDRFLKFARGSASRNRQSHARDERRRRPITGVRHRDVTAKG